MSNKKNLLNEAQVRQFMKLASLQPLTPGFVQGLTEKKEEGYKERLSQHLGPDKGEGEASKEEREHESEGEEKAHGKGKFSGDPEMSEGKDEELEEVHGRGANEYHKAGQHRGGGVKLDEEGLAYRDDPEAELHATEDELGAEDRVADEEGEEVADLEADVDAEGEVDAAAEGTLTVAQVVDAIESALQDLLPDEEVEAEYVDDEEEVEDVDAEAEFAPEGDEVVADVEVGGEELEEATASGLSPAAQAVLDEPEGPADVASKKKRAAHIAATKDQPRGRTRGPGATARFGGGSGAGRGVHRGTFQEGVSADELVEQVTKRVAARILKSALRKK